MREPVKYMDIAGIIFGGEYLRGEEAITKAMLGSVVQELRE